MRHGYINGTRLDSTFPTNYFTIRGYVAPIRFDRNGTKLVIYT